MSKAIAPQINSVIIGGNLTKDPTTVPDNDKLTIIRVASNRQYKTNDEGYKQETAYIDISVWDSLGVLARNRLKKGSPVLIEGRLADSKYKPNQNEEKTISVIRVKAIKIHFLEKDEIAHFDDPEDDSDSKPYGNGN